MALATAGLRLVVSAAGAVAGLMRVQRAASVTAQVMGHMKQTIDDEMASYRGRIDAYKSFETAAHSVDAISKKYNVTTDVALKISRLQQAAIRAEVSQKRVAINVAKLELRQRQISLQEMQAERSERMVLVRQIGTAIRLMREMRIVIGGVTRAFGVQGGVARRSIGRVTSSVRVLQRDTWMASFSVTAAMAGIGGAIGALLGIQGFGGLNSMLRETIRLSGEMESNRVTFDTLLGSSTKTEDLMGRLETFAAKTPFNLTDIIQGSKRLMMLSRDNLDMNEQLVGLSANLAALTGGKRNVAEAAWAVTSAAISGEFENMKSFNVVLRQDMFKNAGEKGGKAYSKAVLGEIAAQFQERTGGRGDELLARLSDTLFGRSSNLVDVAQILGRRIGDALVQGIGLKDLLKDFTQFVDDVNESFKYLMNPQDPELAEKFKTMRLEVKDTALAIRDTINVLRDAMVTLRGYVTMALEWYRAQDSGTRRTILATIVAVSSLATIFSVAVPITTTLAIAVGALGAVFGTILATLGPILQFLGGALVAIVAGFGPVVVVAAEGAVAFGLLAFAFMAFRRENEPLLDTLSRVYDIGRAAFFGVWEPLKATFTTFWKTLLPQLRAQWNELEHSFVGLHDTTSIFFSYFKGQGIITMHDFVSLGFRAANVVGTIVRWVTKAIVAFTRLMTMMSQGMIPIFRQTASDVLQLGKAFVRIITGTGDTMKNFKTLTLAFVDILTSPFRMALARMLGWYEDVLVKIEAAVKPYNKTLAKHIGLQISALSGAQDKILEGFVPTQFDTPPIELNLNLNQKVEMDGEKVAENQRQVNFRARHSGRGGDPMHPQELGFIINSEGTNIRSVGLDSLEFIE